jgi:hypothetical protein
MGFRPLVVGSRRRERRSPKLKGCRPNLFVAWQHEVETGGSVLQPAGCINKKTPKMQNSAMAPEWRLPWFFIQESVQKPPTRFGPWW